MRSQVRISEMPNKLTILTVEWKATRSTIGNVWTPFPYVPLGEMTEQELIEHIKQAYEQWNKSLDEDMFVRNFQFRIKKETIVTEFMEINND